MLNGIKYIYVYAIDQNYSFIYGLITYAKIYLKMSTDIHE